jgi:hypothetical protein
MAVSDHGLEVLRKAAELYLSNPNELLLRVRDSDAADILNDILTALGGSSNTTPAINNVLVVTANVEQTFSLPTNCKGFLIRARQNCRMKFSYALNGTTSSWLTIGLGGYLKDDNKYNSQDIYFQVDRNNTDIEIVTYV